MLSWVTTPAKQGHSIEAPTMAGGYQHASPTPQRLDGDDSKIQQPALPITLDSNSSSHSRPHKRNHHAPNDDVESEADEEIHGFLSLIYADDEGATSC